MARSDQSGNGWTIRKVTESTRGPVTRTTVRELARDKSLRDVAKIAKKYAG
jgi:hypothetical protein